MDGLVYSKNERNCILTTLAIVTIGIREQKPIGDIG